MWEKNDWLDSLLDSDNLQELIKMESEDILVGLKMNGVLDEEGRIPLCSEKGALYAKYSDGDVIYIDQEDVEDWIIHRLEFVDDVDLKEDIEKNLIQNPSNNEV